MEEKGIFDYWSILHFLWGVILYFCTYGICRKLKLKRCELFALLSSTILHTLYEYKDLGRNIPETKDLANKIIKILFGEEWAQANELFPIENSYGDQFCAAVGMLLGMYMVKANRQVVRVGAAVIFIGVIIYIALRLIGPPSNIKADNETTFEVTLMDLFYFTLFTVILTVVVGLIAWRFIGIKF